MNSTAPNYQFSTLTCALNHGWTRPLFVRDTTDEPLYEVDAKALSGDYFVTLATELDDLGNNLPEHADRLKLEGTVSDLIYLQDHYVITRKETE